MFDFESLTGREAALIETLTGLSIDAIAASDAPKAKTLAALTLVAKRREGDKAISFEKVLDWPLADMSAYLGFNEEETDEEGEAEASDEPAPKSKRN